MKELPLELQNQGKRKSMAGQGCSDGCVHLVTTLGGVKKYPRETARDWLVRGALPPALPPPPPPHMLKLQLPMWLYLEMGPLKKKLRLNEIIREEP